MFVTFVDPKLEAGVTKKTNKQALNVIVLGLTLNDLAARRLQVLMTNEANILILGHELYTLSDASDQFFLLLFFGRTSDQFRTIKYKGHLTVKCKHIYLGTYWKYLLAFREEKKKNHTDFVVFGWQLLTWLWLRPSWLLRGLNRCMEYIEASSFKFYILSWFFVTYRCYTNIYNQSYHLIFNNIIEK